jgi:serine/threonine protein kinase/tetratricopeptide (TPR) repeat protein
MNPNTRPADIPATIGSRYRVLGEIGRGGMGRVLKVEHLHTGEILAMRVLWAHRSGAPDMVERFRREARSLAQVRGDHVVRVIDADVAVELGDAPYLVTELLDGEDLNSYLKRRDKLEPAEVSHLLRQLALGLARVHRAGLVHRDLKPGNIFLHRQEGRSVVKLLDFGLVKPAASDADEAELSLTRDGQVVGTPQFMSPEQVHGQATGPASDMWAVGILAYLLLTGRPYWDLRQMPRGVFDVGSAPLQPPSSKAGAEREACLTMAFDAWFMRSCALNPAARWPDPVTQWRELAAALGYPASPASSQTGPITGSEPETVTMVSHATEFATAGGSSRQRRQVTVLFYRFVHSGSAAAEMDPENFEALEMRMHSALDQALGDLRLTSTYLGQGGRFVFFGYPMAYGQDARRAVEAALRLTALARSLNQQAVAEGARGLNVRVGVHTGLALAGPSGIPGGPEVIGSALGIAADLEHEAEAGQILVSETTWQLLGGRFRGEPAGKGHYAALGVQEDSQSTVSAGSAMLGRDAELALLLSCLEEARTGESQMVLISGEVGIGKSRLVNAVREDPGAEGVEWLECSCSPYFQRTPFHPLIDLLRALIQKRELELDEESRQFFELLFSGGEGPQVERLSPAFRRERTIDALIAVLHRRAAATPSVLVVEDLHWADPSTVEFLDRLSVLRSAPLLTLLTTRLNFSPSWSSPAAITPLQLRRLPQAQAAQMIAQISKTALPADVVELVAKTTEGIPLFIEELTRLVAQSPAAAAGTAFGSVPTTLSEALNARLDRLGPARVVAEQAAVIGAEFSLDDLRILTNDEAGLQAQVRELVRGKIFQPRGLPPHATYAFQHALVRAAAYGSLPREARREMHARLASAMVERKAEPEILVHHFEEGGMPAEAAAWSLRAGQAALERSANAEARAHFERGIDLLQKHRAKAPEQAPAVAILEITLWTLKGMAWVVSRGYAVPEAEAAFAAAMDRVRALKLDETAELTPALWAHWIFMLVRGRFGEAEEQGRRLMRLAVRCGDSGVAMLAHLAMGTTLHGTGHFEEALQHLNEGIARYDPAAHGAYRFIYGQDPWMFGSVFKAWSLWCRGFPDSAAKVVDEALAHAQRLRHPNSLGFALALSAIIHHYRGDTEAVERASEALMDLSMEQGWIHWLGHAKLWKGAVQVSRGNLTEGVAGVREARNFAEQGGERSGATHYNTVMIDALCRAGQIDEAAEWIEKTKQSMRAAGEDAFEADLLRMEGEVARLRGDASAARALFAQALESASSKGARSYRLRAALSMARLEREQASPDHPAARARLLEILGEFTEGFETADLRAARAEAKETI